MTAAAPLATDLSGVSLSVCQSVNGRAGPAGTAGMDHYCKTVSRRNRYESGLPSHPAAAARPGDSRSGGVRPS